MAQYDEWIIQEMVNLLYAILNNNKTLIEKHKQQVEQGIVYGEQHPGEIQSIFLQIGQKIVSTVDLWQRRKMKRLGSPTILASEVTHIPKPHSEEKASASPSTPPTSVSATSASTPTLGNVNVPNDLPLPPRPEELRQQAVPPISSTTSQPQANVTQEEELFDVNELKKAIAEKKKKGSAVKLHGRLDALKELDDEDIT